VTARSVKDEGRRSRFSFGKRKVKDRITNDKYTAINIGYNDGGRIWETKKLPDKNPIGINIKGSRRWLGPQRFVKGVAYLPYIDLNGKDSGFKLYKSEIEAPAFIGTVISTVFRRIYMRVRARQQRSARIRQDLLLRCAAYYVVSRNDYFWDRLLVLSSNLEKNYRLISNILHSFLAKLDATERFVHSHACLQAKWLTSRAIRPRDKSKIDKEYSSLLNPKGLQSAEFSLFEYDAIWSVFTDWSN